MNWKSLRSLALLVTFLSGFTAQPRAFAEEQESKTEASAWEARFDVTLQRANVGEFIRHMSARPHHVGSPYSREVAEYIRDKFTSWGYETRIDEYRVLFPTPKTRVLEMVAPGRFTAQLQEPALPEDATSGQSAEQLPTYNAYSVDGDVTGDLVYVNYGIPADYEVLRQSGIDVRGKIVIARYGGSWRGIKPKVAAENGAIGCLIYSDPRDDGYFGGDVYPKGPFRNASGAQRGSVVDMPTYPGDPLTPGVGAVAEADRLSREEAPTLTKIPVLPISYADAEPLLRALEGPMAPNSWKGALPIPYHLGPGPARVRLKLEFNWDLTPAYNVIATIRGSSDPDQWIIRGNHHDAWVNGASDPVSGMASMMEEARGIGELVRQGWRPARTIVYAAWDAEEPGLLGSTEWAEDHASELREKAAVYINSDSNSRGFLQAGGSHSLQAFVNEVAKDVTDPQTEVSVWERLWAAQIENSSGEARTRLRNATELPIYALGSGSDYTPFLQHLGIASLNLSFGGESDGGSYHSIYDSFDHYRRFGDPGFHYGVTQAQVVGRAVIRLASAGILPFQFTGLSKTVGQYLDEVIDLASRMRSETLEMNWMIEKKTGKLASDPQLTYVPQAPKEEVPYLNFAPLQNAQRRLDEAAKTYDTRVRSGASRVASPSSLNQALMSAERLLTREEGLPRRGWYKHQIYAPGYYTGYGVKTLPGVREAIEQRNWSEAENQIGVTATAIERLAAELERLAGLLK